MFLLLTHYHCLECKPIEVGPPVNSEVKVTQSCMTLCDPMDYTVHGILQDGILEWVAFPFSRGSSKGIELRSLALKVDSEPQGKPVNKSL